MASCQTYREAEGRGGGRGVQYSCCLPLIVDRGTGAGGFLLDRFIV